MQWVHKKQNNGFALLLAMIVSSVVLAIGLSILNVSVNQINLSATARESEFAFQAAHAGVDCMWYWRNTDESTFISKGASAPSLNCFNGKEASKSVALVTPSNGVGNTSGHFINAYNYTFSWGTPIRCTEAAMYVMNAGDADLQYDFSSINQGVGTDGLKTCTQGYICTVLISDGYNRSCTDKNSSIYSVQRELTFEF